MLTANEKKALTQALKELRGNPPAGIARYAELASTDLWDGPISSLFDPEVDLSPSAILCPHWEGWRGFSHGCRKLAEWLEERLSFPLYWEPETGHLSDTEPQGEEIDGEYFEPAPYYRIERKEALRLLYGALSDYL